MFEKMSESIPRAFQSLLRGIHTAAPGIIDSYDRSTFRARVVPGVSHLTAKNQEITIQPIDDVLVLMPGGSAGLIDIELGRGDPVLLVYCESGIGGWKSSNGRRQVSPDDLATHQRTDAVAIPVIIPDGLVSSFNSKRRIKMDRNGRVTINDHFTVDP